jgi:hypothetical protein
MLVEGYLLYNAFVVIMGSGPLNMTRATIFSYLVSPLYLPPHHTLNIFSRNELSRMIFFPLHLNECVFGV